MRAGDLVGERFELEHIAGRGGMGAVWRARDRQAGQAVAIKVVDLPPSADSGLAARFERETQVLQQLAGHGGIVSYLAHGITPAGERWLAMEWLEGCDLAQRLNRGRLGLAESVELARRLAEALAVAHARGIIHRDLKPSNVFLVGGELGTPKLLDFGIARAGARHTGTGMMIGTPGYMAPEQARGVAWLDARADIYALGCVLFECVAGRPAFVGENVIAVLAKILIEDAPRLRDVAMAPPQLDALCARLMAKDAGERPADAAHVAELLGQLGELPRATPVPITPTPPSDEQRLVGVLLAAAGEDTPLSPTIAAQPEALAHTAAAVPDVLADAARSFGARVERMADGALVAVLSAPGAATDLASRLARLGQHLRERRGAGPIVLAMGQAVVGARLPIGDAVDRAARLMTRHLGHDGIFLDEITAGLIEGRFAVDREGPHPVLLATAPASESRRLLGQATPFVGRERELGTLLAAWDECVGEPVARAVVVTGVAGLGKSRIRHELERSLSSRGESYVVWLGRGDPMTAGSPLGILGDALRRGLGHERADLAALGLAEHEPFIAELVGLHDPDDSSRELAAARRDPQLMAERLRAAFEAVALATCKRQPLLLILEDLHWGDASTVRFVDRALRTLREQPFMVLALARPEVHDLFPRLWASHHAQLLPLGELGRRASERLVHKILPRADEATVARLVEHAGGNAFYLEELIRAVAEGQSGELPATVLAMAQARVEALDADERQLLRSAAVFGEAFSAASVAALLGASPQAVAGRLDALVERELVAPRADSQRYGFRHAYLRDGAYAMFTDEGRRTAHLAAGRWLAASDPDADALAIASHFERGGAPVEAAPFHLRAATQALEADDLTGALNRARAGLVAAPPGRDRDHLRLIEVEALLWMGERHASLGLARKLYADAPRGELAWCKVAGYAAAATVWSWDLSLLGSLVADIVSVSPEPGAQVAYVICLCRTACQLYISRQGHIADPIRQRLGQLLAAAPQLRDDPTLVGWLAEVEAFHNVSVTLDLAAAHRHFIAAARGFAMAGDQRNACAQAHNLLFVQCELGLFQGCIANADALIAQATPLGLHRMLPTTYMVRGCAQLALGNHQAAIADLEEGLERMGDDAAHRAYASAGLALVHLSRGDAQAAQTAFARSGMTAGSSRVFAGVSAVHAETLLARGDTAGALAVMEEAVTHQLGVLGGPINEVQRDLTRIRCLRAAGQDDRARHQARQGLEYLERSTAAISDPDLRRMYAQVPHHRELRRLASELLA